MRVLLAATIFVLFLEACGIKGPLVLPPSRPTPAETADTPDDEQPPPDVDNPE